MAEYPPEQYRQQLREYQNSPDDERQEPLVGTGEQPDDIALRLKRWLKLLDR